MSKEYYVTKENSDFFVNRPNGCLLTRAANVDNAKHICAELNRLLHRIPDLKHDPFRKFRKGDSVSPCFWNDRPPAAYDINEITAHFMPENGLYTVNKDELPDSTVLVEYKGKIITMQTCHLELITPVEKLEPYFVSDDDYEYCVFDRRIKMTVCRFDMSHPHAKEAAEAECARLNAEYRKELK